MPAATVEISSTEVTVEQSSLAIDKRIEERSTASFTVIDRDGTGTYARGEPVEITDPDSAVIFAGFIDTPGKARLHPTGGLLHDITCMENHYLADKRLAVKSYANVTAGYIATDLFNSYLAGEGVTVGEIQDGPTIAEAIFNYVKVSDCFEALKELSGFTWKIDEGKRLYFVDRVTNRAAWDLDNSTYKPLPNSVHLSGGNPLYRNTQYVRGGKGATSQQTETFAADGVLKSFAVGYPLAQEPTIYEDAALQTVGIKGLESGKDYYWNKGDNSVTAEAVPGNGVDVKVYYYGQYPLIAMSLDYAAILDRQTVEGAGTGIVEEIVTEAQHETSPSIQESASAKIKQYCRDAEKFTYGTYDSGLFPGQMQAITYPLFGFSAHDMLIESVSIRADGNHLLYEVACITGPAMGSWAKFFANILRRQDNSIRIGDSLLLVLLQQREDLDLSEATDSHTDDFSSGLVNRTIAAPPDQSAMHNVEHERLDISEAPAITTVITEHYLWG